MKLHTTNLDTLFPVYTEWISFPLAIKDLKFPSNYTILFIAADFNLFSKKQARELFFFLVENNVEFICLWGPECENIKDIFDEAAYMNPSKTEFICVEHENESLEEALWFCIFHASTREKIWGETSIVLLSIDKLLGQLTLPVIANDLKYLSR